MATQAALAIQARPQRVVWIFRGALLILCLVVAATAPHFGRAAACVAALLAIAAASSRLSPEARPARFARAAEVVAACVAIYVTSRSAGPFFLLITVPVLAAGLFSGAIDAIILTGLGSGALLTVGAAAGWLTDVSYLDNTGQALVLALAVGLVAAWARRLLRLQPAVDQPLFGAAYRLLTQLRTVARQLPGSLDPVSVSTDLVKDVGAATSAEQVAVFSRTQGGRLVAVAGDAELAQRWDVDVTGDSLFAEAWASQEHRSMVVADDRWLVVVPLLVGVRTIGLVGMEGSGAVPSAAIMSPVSSMCADAALRLETALLFDEVRELATVEERQRVAREIHDGIAQELVIVGYGIDNAMAELGDESPAAGETMRDLRAEVTRIISELRLSLFDLRSDIDPHGGLGAAISAHVRTLGTTSGLTVHLTMNESPQRLPAAVEAELFRITQEAVTNARKHAHASNLWVSVQVKPPQAVITVEDDGLGMSGNHRQDSFGQSIMRERAARLGALLEISGREGQGTRVAVRLGSGAPGRSLATGYEDTGSEGHADRPARR